MHPVDEVEAYARLVAGELVIEDVTRFAQSVVTVRQRSKLAARILDEVCSEPGAGASHRVSQWVHIQRQPHELPQLFRQY